MRNEELKGEHVGTGCAASNLLAMASTLVAMASSLVAMAANLLAMASNLYSVSSVLLHGEHLGTLGPTVQNPSAAFVLCIGVGLYARPDGGSVKWQGFFKRWLDVGLDVVFLINITSGAESRGFAHFRRLANLSHSSHTGKPAPRNSRPPPRIPRTRLSSALLAADLLRRRLLARRPPTRSDRARSDRTGADALRGGDQELAPSFWWRRCLTGQNSKRSAGIIDNERTWRRQLTSWLGWGVDGPMAATLVARFRSLFGCKSHGAEPARFGCVQHLGP